MVYIFEWNLKKCSILITLLFLLTACTADDSKEADSTGTQSNASTFITIQPAELSEREQTIINQIGGDYQSFFTIKGDLGPDETIVQSIGVYREGQKEEERLTSFSDSLEGDLHSYQLRLEDETTYLRIGFPSGSAGASTVLPDQLGTFVYQQMEEEFTLTKGEPVYVAYLIGSSQNSMSFRQPEDWTTVPTSVQEAEYSIVFKVEWRDTKDHS
ncbi:hypothetical protein EQV77_06655 [Halobacillus fulvus]|nr:hypothetical protein EQV77_06655 [Halobacillus fulvus]